MYASYSEGKYSVGTNFFLLITAILHHVNYNGACIKRYHRYHVPKYITVYIFTFSSSIAVTCLEIYCTINISMEKVNILVFDQYAKNQWKLSTNDEVPGISW